jgi:Chaperone of endosialidase
MALTFLYLAAGTQKSQAVIPPPDGGYPGFNTAEGQNALFNLTTGSANTAVGWFSLWGNTQASFNTATGAGALLFNTADNNAAFGGAALLFNTTGFNNTAVGAAALLNNNLGIDNTALGANALFSNSASSGDTATGGPSSVNTAVGSNALFSNTTGAGNTVIGAGALDSNTIGNTNTAIGIGTLSQTSTGSLNIALGGFAGGNVFTANNVIAIGLPGENEDNRCYIGQIRGVTVGNADGINVIIDSDGQLGTINSSRRFKKDVKPMDQTSEAILALKPVMFHYKKCDTKTQPSQFGLIAEDVAEVNPDLIVRDADGQPLSVRYDAVNAMLLNEFLKEHRKVEKLEAAVGGLKSEMKALAATLNEQALQLQKVSAQLQIHNAATQVIAGNR